MQTDFDSQKEHAVYVAVSERNEQTIESIRQYIAIQFKFKHNIDSSMQWNRFK